MPRPTADVKIGDEITAWPPFRNEPFPMWVIKVGRAWITAEAASPGEIRFRIDTQRDADQRFRFKTAEQIAYDERLTEARRVLAEREFLTGSHVLPDEVIALGEFLAALPRTVVQL